jgi:hypothetical protein
MNVGENDYQCLLDRKERKEFDDMWDIPRLYITACSNSVQLVPLHPIMISILFHHYKELMQLEAQIDQVKEEEEQSKELEMNMSLTLVFWTNILSFISDLL